MELINCILCNKNDTHLLVRKDSFNVVQCNGCGLTYVNPRMDMIELSEFYNESNSSAAQEIVQKDTEHDEYKIKKFKTAIQLLKRHKEDIEKVFDIGCSTGIFLEMAAKEGWTPYGCDVNRNLVRENRKRYGDQVKLQEGKHIDFKDNFFDVITLFDVIEHLTNPVDTLKEVSRVLKEDGLVVISTPNIDGLFPRLTYALFGKTIGAWEHPTPPGHVFQFSKRSLQKTTEKASLELVDCKDFEIYIRYTIRELENSMVNVLRKTNQGNGNDNQVPEKNKNNRNDNDHFLSSSFFNVRKLPRLLIRGSCWGLVHMVYPFARLFKRGDSIVVIVNKNLNETKE